MKGKIKTSNTKFVSALLAFIFLFTIFLQCGETTKLSAAVSLTGYRAQLKEYIMELFLKGPATDHEIAEKMRQNGVFGEFDYEAGDYEIFVNRRNFDLSLFATDELGGYFFTDKSAFLTTFGTTTYTFSEDKYYWYPQTSAATANGVSVANTDALIVLNISTVLNYALDVYGFCVKDTDLFSDEFDVARQSLLKSAIDAVYKVITALKAQIGEGDAKPSRYKAEYADVYTTESSGLYPYLDTKFKNNTPVMSTYTDSSAYKRSTVTYNDLKANPQQNAALSAFQSAYNTFKSEKDGGVLYYDFLNLVKPVKEAYDSLCQTVLSSQTTDIDLTEKIKAYMTLVGLAEVFYEYILPFASDYPSDINAVKINYTTIRTLIYFVGDNPYKINELSLTAMTTLIENFTESIKKLQPISGKTQVDNKISAAAANILKITSLRDTYEGVVGADCISAYKKVSAAIEKLSAFTSSAGALSSEKAVAAFDGKTVYVAKNSVIFNPSESSFERFYSSLLVEGENFYQTLLNNVPVEVSHTQTLITPLTETLNNHVFLVGLNEVAVSPLFGLRLDDSFVSDTSMLKEALKIMWNTQEIPPNALFDLSEIFSIIADYCITLADAEADEINFNATNEILKRAISNAETDMNKYTLALSYQIENIASLFNISLETNTGLADEPENGFYVYRELSSVSDGTDIRNPKNYKTDVFRNLVTSMNEALIAISQNISPTLIFIAGEDLSACVNEMFSDYGKDMFSKFTYDLFSLLKGYYGSEDLTSYFFNSIVSSKNVELKQYIALNSQGQVSESELVQKYFAFTLSAVSKDETRSINLYNFVDNKIYTNLITPLENLLKTRINYAGSYARDVAEEATYLMDAAQNLVSSVNLTQKNIISEITVHEAEKLLANLSELSSKLSENSLSAIASYKVSGLDALIDKAKSKTHNSTFTAPYYALIYKLFTDAYSEATNTSFDKTSPKSTIDYATTLLSETLKALEDFEKSMSDEVITTKDFETAISNAEKLRARYDKTESTSYISDLTLAIDEAKYVLSIKLSTFTSEELKSEIAKITAATQAAKKLMFVEENFKTEINKAIATVKSSMYYTAATWNAYVTELNAANALAASTTATVSECEYALEKLKTAVLFLEEESTESEENTEITENQTQNQSESTNTDVLAEAEAFYRTSMDEFTQYLLSNSYNGEKGEVWKVSLQNLKAAIDSKSNEATILQYVIAVQLAKAYIPVENPETTDDFYEN